MPGKTSRSVKVDSSRALGCPRRGAAAAVALFAAHVPWSPEAEARLLGPAAAEAPQTGAGGAESIDFETLFNMDVVSATKTGQKAKEAPAIVAVVTERDIRERGYRSVAEALRVVPGFAILYDQYSYNAGLRGINGGLRGWSRIIKVMIDGQPTALRTDGSNFLGPELIPVELVKRIEIIRGPVAALYGADAFLGVVNVVTRRGSDLRGGALAARGLWAGRGGVDGSLALGQQAAVLDRTLDFALGAAAGLSDRSGLGVAGSSPRAAAFTGRTTEDLARPRSLFGSARLGGAAEGTLSVLGSYQGSDSGAKFADWSIGQSILDSENLLSVDNGAVRARYERALTDSLSSSLAAAYVAGGPTERDRLDIGKPYYQIRKSGFAGWDLGGEVRYQFGERNSLTAGADYTTTEQRIQTVYNRFKTDFGVNLAGSEKLEGTDQGSRTFTNVGVFAQGIAYPTDQLGLTVGARSDTHNVYGGDVNTRAGLVYRWSETLTSKLLYGTSFKAPSPVQLFSAPIAVGDIVGNPDLKPERARTLESALSWEAARNLRAETNVYYTQVDGLVQFVVEGSNQVAKNTAQAATVGVEGTVDGQLEPFRGYLNGSIQFTRVEGEPEALFKSRDQRAELFPTTMANAGVAVPVPALPADLYLETRFMGAMKPSRSNFMRNNGVDYEVPASWTVDLNLASRNLQVLGRPFEASVRISNLLDGVVVYPGFNGIDIPGEGRSVTVRLSQRF